MELGCIDVITKNEAGGNFYLDLASQLDKIFTSVLEKNGGVMSLIDVFLYYNRLRGSDVITTGDLLLACEELKKINTRIEFRNLDGLKVIQIKS